MSNRTRWLDQNSWVLASKKYVRSTNCSVNAHHPNDKWEISQLDVLLISTHYVKVPLEWFAVQALACFPIFPICRITSSVWTTFPSFYGTGVFSASEKGRQTISTFLVCHGRLFVFECFFQLVRVFHALFVFCFLLGYMYVFWKVGQRTHRLPAG